MLDMPSLGSAGILLITINWHNASTTYGKGNTTASGRSEAHFIAWFCNCTFPFSYFFILFSALPLPIFETNQTTYNNETRNIWHLPFSGCRLGCCLHRQRI